MGDGSCEATIMGGAQKNESAVYIPRDIVESQIFRARGANSRSPDAKSLGETIKGAPLPKNGGSGNFSPAQSEQRNKTADKKKSKSEDDLSSIVYRFVED